MTPAAMAMIIRRDHDPDTEPVQAFILRRFAKEEMSTLRDALHLMMAWERGYDDFGKLLAILKPVSKNDPDASINALVARKRALGYDAALEAILARRWRCPHCKQYSTILTVEMPVGDASRLPRCTICNEEGIAPIDGAPKFDVRDGGKRGLRPI